MMRILKRWTGAKTALVFWVLPCVLGLGCAQILRWTDTVWLATAGGFWPITLTVISVAILIRRMFSPFSDRTIAGTAWVTLVLAWFLAPLWTTAVNVPFASAVVSRDGHVHNVRDVARYPEYKVWFMIDHPGTRTVHNVSGKIVASSIEIDYRYSDSYIATRQHNEDLAEPLTRAASVVLKEEAQRPRAAKIALVDDAAVQNRVIERICRKAVGDRIACPLKMKMLPQNEATGLGGTWSKYYSEREAIDEKHLPTLVRLLTTPDSSIADADRVFTLFMTLADTVEPLSQVAQHPYFLRDEQFDELIQRILIAPDCGDEAVAILPKSNRLTAAHRSALRTKALTEASIGKIVAQAGPLHISDAEIVALAPRMQAAFVDDAEVAVRALEAFGARLPTETQRAAVDRIIAAKASYALAALAHVNFADDLRRDLMTKVLADGVYEDFSVARLTKEKLQAVLVPAEMKALIAMAVRESDQSKQWFEFALSSLPIRAMSPAERQSLLTGLMFESPKAAMEFVSKNRAYLDPAEVNEVTRGYSRTIAADFCLHLSHRNKNWRVDFFSDDQLQIFRECAEQK
jgi:hypothetical protein